MSKTLTNAQIEAAKEAGFYWHPVRKGLVVRHSSGSWVSVDDMLARFVALLATQQPEPRDKPIAWESTTPVYTKYITEDRYQKFSPEVRKWYKPYRCSACSEPRDEVTDDDKLCASRYRWLSRQVVATHSRDDLNCRWEVDYVLYGESFDAAVLEKVCGEPVGWLHVMHMEGGQTQTRLTEDAEDHFGVPGEDYSEEYVVTSEPLYALTRRKP